MLDCGMRNGDWEIRIGEVKEHRAEGKETGTEVNFEFRIADCGFKDERRFGGEEKRKNGMVEWWEERDLGLRIAD